MSRTDTATILARRFRAKRASITGAARVIPEAAANGRLHIMWPRDDRSVWGLKRLLPAWFVSRVAQLRDRQLARATALPG